MLFKGETFLDKWSKIMLSVWKYVSFDDTINGLMFLDKPIESFLRVW